MKIPKKWKKYLEILSINTSVPKIMIICFPAPEIWHMTNVIIFHFGHFFALLHPPPPPLTTPKMKMKKKWKKKICLEISSLNSVPKMWLYAILFLRYCMWRINCHFSFWAIFCPFIPLKTSEMKISKKWKKCLEISFYTIVPKIMIICYTAPGYGM